MAEELKFPQALPMPEHGGFDCIYDLAEIRGQKIEPTAENVEGLAFFGKDIIQMNTPNFEVTPPTRITFKQENSTTHRWTMQIDLNEKQYFREFIIKTDGSTDQNVLSMTLPSGRIIEFVNG